jgi:hypothetical protein
MDAYNDWFEDKDEAERFLAEVRELKAGETVA